MSHSLFKKGFRRRRILLFMWQVRIIDYGTMLGDILVISRRLWVMSRLVIINYSTTLNPLALPVCRLQFSMLVGAVEVTETAQALEAFFVIKRVLCFVDSQDLLAFRIACMCNCLRSCMI